MGRYGVPDRERNRKGEKLGENERGQWNCLSGTHLESASDGVTLKGRLVGTPVC